MRDDLAARFVATGGSQCGFCTPGILVRLAAAEAKDKTRRVDLDRALAAHLCRCTGMADGLRRRRRSPAATAIAARPGSRRPDAPSSRVACRSSWGRGSRWATAASPTTALHATHWSRCRCPPGSAADASRGGRDGVGGRRLAARGACARGQGAGTPHDGRSRRRRSALPRCRARRRAPRHVVGRARVPRARCVVVRAGRRARDAARQRRRVRRQGGVTGRCRGARARRPHRTHGARRVRTRRRRAPRTEAPADRGHGGRSTGRRCTSAGSSWAAVDDVHRADRRGRTRSTNAASGRARRCRARRRRRRSARSGSPSGPSSSRARCTSPAPIAPRSCVTTASAACCSTPVRRSASGALAGARVTVDDDGTDRPRARCASRPATRSTRSCCVPTRSAPRTWRSAGCSPRGSRSTPPPARCTTSPSVRSAILRPKDTPPIDVEIVDDPGAPLRACVRRGVRRGRGRDVERGQRRRRRAARSRSRLGRRAPPLRSVADLRATLAR